MTLEQMPERRFLHGLVMEQGILICLNVLVQNVSPVFVFHVCGQVPFCPQAPYVSCHYSVLKTHY